MPRLVVENLAKQFGRRVLFRHLSFALEAGESLTITGANGAGKTTLLKMLAGVLRPTEGHVALEMAGRAVPAEEHSLHVGLVGPYLNVYDSFSARENLAFLARARRLAEAETHISEVLSEVGLAERADDRVSTLSSGLKQRILYAAALLTAPPLLLLDEPQANLDERGLAMTRRIQARQREQDRLLVVATNRSEEAEHHARQLHIGS